MPYDNVVGYTFLAWDGKVYECTGFKRDTGYDMVQTDHAVGKVPRKTNISERAIGRTFHKVDSVKRKIPHEQSAAFSRIRQSADPASESSATRNQLGLDQNTSRRRVS